MSGSDVTGRQRELALPSPREIVDALLLGFQNYIGSSRAMGPRKASPSTEIISSLQQLLDEEMTTQRLYDKVLVAHARARPEVERLGPCLHEPLMDVVNQCPNAFVSRLIETPRYGGDYASAMEQAGEDHVVARSKFFIDRTEKRFLGMEDILLSYLCWLDTWESVQLNLRKGPVAILRRACSMALEATKADPRLRRFAEHLMTESRVQQSIRSVPWALEAIKRACTNSRRMRQHPWLWIGAAELRFLRDQSALEITRFVLAEERRLAGESTDCISTISHAGHKEVQRVRRELKKVEIEVEHAATLILALDAMPDRIW